MKRKFCLFILIIQIYAINLSFSIYANANNNEQKSQIETKEKNKKNIVKNIIKLEKKIVVAILVYMLQAQKKEFLEILEFFLMGMKILLNAMQMIKMLSMNMKLIWIVS